MRIWRTSGHSPPWLSWPLDPAPAPAPGSRSLMMFLMLPHSRMLTISPSPFRTPISSAVSPCLLRMLVSVAASTRILVSLRLQRKFV